MRGMTPSGLGPVLELQLAGRQFLECDREVVLATVGVNHRRRVLAEVALAEVVVVAVDLAGALGRHDYGGVMGVRVIDQFVYAWMNHPGDCTSSALTTRSSSPIARSSSSLTTS